MKQIVKPYQDVYLLPQHRKVNEKGDKSRQGCHSHFQKQCLTDVNDHVSTFHVFVYLFCVG